MDDIFRKKLGRHGGHFLKGSGDAIVDFFGVNGGVKKKIFRGKWEHFVLSFSRYSTLL